jgi:putative FmdB family regulatory protein
LLCNQCFCRDERGIELPGLNAMPIYEYRCTACGHELEALQKINDAQLTSCPVCRTDTLTKLVSAAGFQLKGSGWYATDFRNGSKPAAKSSNGEAKSDGKTSEGKTSESKSESKGDSSGETKTAAATAGGCGGGCACH